MQIVIKAINDSVGFDGIVPTLLVFGVYPRMINKDALSLLIIKRAKAIRVATKEIRRFHIERQITDALALRNGPNTKFTLDLLILSNVRV